MRVKSRTLIVFRTFNEYKNWDCSPEEILKLREEYPKGEYVFSIEPSQRYYKVLIARKKIEEQNE